MTSSADIRIRSAREGDAPELVRMRLLLQDHMESRNSALASMSEVRKLQLADEYRFKISGEDTKAVVATAGPDEGIIGMALGSVSRREDLSPSTWGRIDDVWMDEHWRRRGFAAQMLLGVIEFFQARGASSVVLEYSVGNPEAEAVWRSLGFNPVLTTAVAATSELLLNAKRGFQ